MQSAKLKFRSHELGCCFIILNRLHIAHERAVTLSRTKGPRQRKYATYTHTIYL